MANESDRKAKLTINDPVDPVVLKRIGEIQNRRFQLGDAMIDLEQEKIKLIVESRKLDDEKTRLFAGIFSSRGIMPGTPIEIDPENGRLSFIKTNGRAEVPAAPPEVPHGATTPAPPPDEA